MATICDQLSLESLVVLPIKSIFVQFQTN